MKWRERKGERERGRGGDTCFHSKFFLFKIKPTQQSRLLMVGQSPGPRQSVTTASWPPAWEIQVMAAWGPALSHLCHSLIT